MTQLVKIFIHMCDLGLVSSTNRKIKYRVFRGLAIIATTELFSDKKRTEYMLLTWKFQQDPAGVVQSWEDRICT